MRGLLLKLIYAWERMCNLLLLTGKKVQFDKSIRFHGVMRIFGRGTVRIGKNVLINSKTSANPAMGCYPRTVFNVTSGTLEIGDDVGMSGAAISCAEGVQIGSHVMLGGGVKIMDSDAHSLEYWKRGKGAGIDVPVTRPVRICDHVFVGANAMILKGVTIGEAAIIGAGAVVTKNVPAGEIWGGNPAKKIGEAPRMPSEGENT